jgi:hypothetical protein
MGHTRHRFQGHAEHLVRPSAAGLSDKADAAGVTLAAGIELARRVERRVARVVLTGTGRVDPLPSGGHGASCG